MFHLHPGSFGIGFEDPRADRDRMHRIALHEARIATEHRAGASEHVAVADTRRRQWFRFALPGGLTTTDVSGCCA